MHFHIYFRIFVDFLKQTPIFAMIFLGLDVVLLYMIISLAADRFSLELSLIMTFAVALAGGAVGGILGVNRK